MNNNNNSNNNNSNLRMEAIGTEPATLHQLRSQSLMSVKRFNTQTRNNKNLSGGERRGIERERKREREHLSIKFFELFLSDNPHLLQPEVVLLPKDWFL